MSIEQMQVHRGRRPSTELQLRPADALATTRTRNALDYWRSNARRTGNPTFVWGHGPSGLCRVGIGADGSAAYTRSA